MKHWNYAFQILARLQGLKHLIVDLKMAFCSHGCCRMIGQLCNIIPDSAFLQPGIRIDVQGQASDDEMVKIRGAFVIGAKAVASRKNKYIPPFGIRSLRKLFHGENDKIEDEKNDADDPANGSEKALTRHRKPSMILKLSIPSMKDSEEVIPSHGKPSMIVKLSIPSMKDKNDNEEVLYGHLKPSMIVKLSMPSLKNKKTVPEE